MPVGFLSKAQRDNYGRYTGDPSSDDLARYFHLDDADLALIAAKRGEHNRLGFAVQLGTVRYLGTFLEDPVDVPNEVVKTLSEQLYIDSLDGFSAYRSGEQRWQHAAEIRIHFGYADITEPKVGWRLGRWLYALCWTGTDRPGILFERATTWLVTHKVLLPGCTTLERFVARLRNRVEERLWRLLVHDVSSVQQAALEALLNGSVGRSSPLDRLRTPPVIVSGIALVQAVLRLRSVRDLGIRIPAAARIPASRVAALARFASAAKVTALLKLPNPRRLATLVAFVHCLEASAQDDALDVLVALLSEMFRDALRAQKKTRLRTLKDLDQAAATLARACQMVLDPELPDVELRTRLFEKISRETLAQALAGVNTLIRPGNALYHLELENKYRTARRFVPILVEHVQFGSNAAGEPVVAGLKWLHENMLRKVPVRPAPREVIGKSWQSHVFREEGAVDLHAYTLCLLDKLQTAIKRRDVFVTPSWRYADPRAGLLQGAEWVAARPIVCRTLGLSMTPEPTLAALATELDRSYRAVCIFRP